jgi:tRNA 2-thiouridine synthesizing protein A
MMSDNHPAELLDVSRLLCPLPVLKARKRLETLESGAELVVVATDPMAMIDMPHFCQEQGHQLLSATQDSDTIRFRIRKA